jgi:hypothetical protein
MNTVLGRVNEVLWLSQPVMQAALALLIWKRKLLRTYSYFFTYLLAEALLFGPLFFTRNQEYYYEIYWVTAAVGIGLGFRVILEVFMDALRPYHALRDFSAMLFRWAGAVVLLIAIAAAISGPRTGYGLITSALLSMERSVRVMQVGLVLFLLMFSRYLGVSRRHPSFGVALGFAVFAVAELALLGFHAGELDLTTINFFNMGAYNGALVIWLMYLFRNDRRPQAMENLLQSQRWNMSLGELTQPIAAESLMPTFDAIVDRAFTRASKDKEEGQTSKSDPVAECEHISKSVLSIRQAALLAGPSIH